MAITDSTVFLTVQRVEGEQPSGETEFVNELLGRRNFMGLVGGADQHMPQDQGPIRGQGAEDLQRLLILEPIKTAAQGFAI